MYERTTSNFLLFVLACFQDGYVAFYRLLSKVFFAAEVVFCLYSQSYIIQCFEVVPAKSLSFGCQLVDYAVDLITLGVNGPFWLLCHIHEPRHLNPVNLMISFCSSLNKLTPENFERVATELTNVALKSEAILTSVIDLVSFYVWFHPGNDLFFPIDADISEGVRRTSV